MIRTRSLPSLPVLLVLGFVLALATFGITRALLATDASALPPLDIGADTQAAAPGALNPTELFAQRAATTVAIESDIADSPMIGSGVVVDAANGTIVTASHVVQVYAPSVRRASHIYVKFQNHSQVEAALVAIDVHNDLAILRVDPAQVPGIVAAPLAANADKVVTGSEVALIGSPYGNEWSVSDGIVSATHRVINSRINGAWEIPDAIQYDAPTNQGNSGGPLFNARGEVIGIVQSINSDSKSDAGVNFAVSSTIVARALELSKTTDEIPYAWLGVDAITLSPQLASANNLGVDAGALVQTVSGPAQRAGISPGTQTTVLSGRSVRLGDVITRVEDQPITSREDLQRITGRLNPDASVAVVVRRAGKNVTLNVNPARAAYTALA